MKACQKHANFGIGTLAPQTRGWCARQRRGILPSGGKRHRRPATGHSMIGIDPDVGHLRFWVASGAAALLVLVCALALDWTRTRIVARFAVIGLGAAFGAVLAWAFLAGASVRDQSAERRNLEVRAGQLTTQALAPGSPLACLEGMAGGKGEGAGGKARVGRPGVC